MRVKLVHGTNSMICENNVLPAYMCIPRGSYPWERTPFLATGVQVDTKQKMPVGTVLTGSQARKMPFNRTVVVSSGNLLWPCIDAHGSSRVIVTALADTEWEGRHGPIVAGGHSHRYDFISRYYAKQGEMEI